MRRVLFISFNIRSCAEGGYVSQLEDYSNYLKITYMDKRVKYYPIAAMSNLKIEFRNYCDN